MNNPKTTIAGYLVLAASLLMLVGHALGSGLSPADLTAVIGAASAMGLIAARDGGH